MSIHVDRSSFRFLIAVTTGLTCTAALAIGLTIWWMHSNAICDASEDNGNLAVVLADQIANSIQSIDLVLTEIQGQVEIRGAQAPNDIERVIRGEDTHQSLMELLARLQQAEFIGLVDKNGRLVNSTQKWPSPELDLSDRNYFQHFKSNNDKGIYTGNSEVDRIKGTQVVFFSKRINGADNTFLGAVTVGVRLTYFQHIYESIASLRDQSFILLHRDGTVIVRYPDPTGRGGEKVPAASLWYGLVSQGGGQFRSQSFFDGEARLIAVRPLRDYPLVVDVAESETAALASWRNQAITLGIGTLLVMFCSALLLKALSKQFHHLATSEMILKRANATVDAALHNMSQGLVMFDSSARLVVCNHRYLDMYGLSPEAVRPSCTFRELLDHRIAGGSYSTDDIDKYMGDIQAAIGQGTVVSKITELHDGRVISIVNHPTADGGWVATHEDVTDKIQAEDIIKLQKQQLNATLENVSQGVCMFDAAQRLIFCNKHYATLYELNGEQTKPGTSLRTILEQRIAGGNSPDDYKNYIKDRLSEVSINQPYQMINQLRDGRQILVVHRPMADGGWVATHEDVTEVNRREESFRMLFEGNPVPMWVIDRESLCFLAVNEAAVTHYDYSREQFLSMTALDLRPAQDRERFAAFVHGLSGDHLIENVTQHSKADGTIIDACVYSRVLTYAGHNARLVAIHDITQAKLAEEELRRTQKFLDTVIERIPLPIIVKDVAGLESDARGSQFTLFNRAYEELTGESRIQSIGKTAHQIFPKERADLIVQADNEALQSDQIVLTSEHPILTSHNGTRLVVAQKTVIRDENGKPQYLLTIVDDVTERNRAEQRILHMAHYDTLTDLPNRASFNDTIDATLDRAASTGEQFAVLSIDLDGFKETNDTYGHMVGDALLREVARRLQTAAGEAFLARLGGDEFALIGVNGTQPAAAAALAERLFAVFADDFEVEGHCLKLGMSIGVAIYPTDGADAKALLTNADAALYRAKTETRGMAMFFEPEMSARLHERYALQEDLRSAIDRGELLLHYQPQVTMSGETIGFEALARWQCPKRGMVPPGTFIPIAEESSLIIPVGEWILREACREAAFWPQPLTIAVNISPIQFRHGELPRLVHSILLETGLAPGRLELEITESVMINDFSRAITILNRLKSLGVRIAMDDFGTGYSSLSYLQSFHCDKIKIDRSFICDLESNYHSRAIVRAVIGLGQSLDLPILAEGVETEDQHAFLVQEGCDEVQGYLTGRPLPIADYAKLVGRQAIAQNNYAIAG